MIKRLGFVIVILLLSSQLFAEDTVKVVSFSASDQVNNLGIHGFKVNVQIKAFQKSPDLDTNGYIHISIYENGNPVLTNFRSYVYGNSSGQVDYNTFFNLWNYSFFIPYYVLNLSQGTHELEAKISAKIHSLSSEAVKVVPSVNMTNQNFKIQMPALKKLKIKVDELRVMEYNHMGANWDVYGRPDLRWKIYMTTGWNGERMYASPKVKNTISAAWIDYSNIIYTAPGDQFCIYLVDADPAFDDTIGFYIFTHESFIETMKNPLVLNGRMTHCKMEYEVVP